MADVIDRIAEEADSLLAMLNNVIGTTLRDPPRVKAARAVIEAVVAVDFRLQAIVDEIQATLESDGVLIVVMDDQTAEVIVMSGGETIKSELLDANNGSPGEDSYCKYCVANKATFVTHDAKATAALKGNPYVDIVRGYVGAALIVNDYAVGALCATSEAPRQWSDEEVGFLMSRSREVSAILEAALLRFHAPGE